MSPTPSMDPNQRRRLELQAEVLKAVGHPTRLAIVWVLREGERCVQDLAEAVGAERSNVSRHLSVLAKVGILGTRKQGVSVFYTLRTPCILSVLGCATDVLLQDIDEGARLLRSP